MPHEVRQANLQKDHSLLTDILSRHLAPDAGGQRFDWLYEENPDGRALAWIAAEPDTGKGLGVASAFPRRISVGGDLRSGCVLGDFCIDPQYRSLGLALQLQRACLEGVGLSTCAVSYDFPSSRMMAVYLRMRIAPFGQMVRWAKPLRAERKITDLVRYPSLARGLAVPVNKLLQWWDRVSMSRGGWTIAPQESECGDEFTTLACNTGSRYGTCVHRSAEYLNWRYRRHPLRRYEMLTVRREGALAGYVIFSHTGEDASIVDLFGLDDTAMWTALVAEIVVLLRGRGVITLSTSLLASDPRAGLLKKLGFRARESCPVVVYGHGDSGAASADAASSWMLMDGDRES
jgi:GNAT superfamily N-acetyltransferase